MSETELSEIEVISQIDELIRRLDAWSVPDSPWEPMNRSRALIRHVLERLQTLRLRLESPLVVATFGGTGTGKSTLINALVGRDCVQTGRSRPTTMQPTILVHPKVDLESVGLPTDHCDVRECDASLLRDIILIDCPDPDTSEAADRGTNLERLRELLPYCDVLIYTSTQQKYRSACVNDELGQAASGCRLVFVQTHADLDADIRDDWKKQLQADYDVPDMYFVDGETACKNQKDGLEPDGDFGRLRDMLTRQLAFSQRLRVRRSNLLDLIRAVLERCREQLADAWPLIEQLERVLDEQRETLISTMSTRLSDELQTNRNLWERRLLTSVTQHWGFSPFSAVLRLYNGLGNLIASASFFRARSSAQLALIGAWQGTRWLTSRRREREAEDQLQQLTSLGLDDALLRESRVVMAGYVRDARLDPGLVEQRTLDRLRQAAADVEGRFLGDAGRRIDEIIDTLAVRNTGFFTRVYYELLFMLYVGFVLFRVGKNFFYDSLIHHSPLFSMDFYVSGGVFFVLWSGLLLILYTNRLRRGLTGRIRVLAAELATCQFSNGLYPELEECCQTIHIQRERLESLAGVADSLHQQLDTPPQLGRVFSHSRDA